MLQGLLFGVLREFRYFQSVLCLVGSGGHVAQDGIGKDRHARPPWGSIGVRVLEGGLTYGIVLATCRVDLFFMFGFNGLVRRPYFPGLSNAVWGREFSVLAIFPFCGLLRGGSFRLRATFLCVWGRHVVRLSTLVWDAGVLGWTSGEDGLVRFSTLWSAPVRDDDRFEVTFSALSNRRHVSTRTHRFKRIPTS